MFKKTYITDDDGVIIGDSNQQFIIFDNQKGYLFRAKNNFVKVFEDIKLSEIIKDKKDFMQCHILAENIYRDTNMIAFRVNARRIRAADIEDISIILDISYRKAREFLNRMKKLHIIAERVDQIGDTVSSKYYFNPLYFCSKKYLAPDLYFLFQESLDCYLKPWVIAKFHEVGNIKKETHY